MQEKKGLTYETVYLSEWLNNKRHGHGIYEDGYLNLKYEGEWAFGRRNGKGCISTFTLNGNGVKIYEGNWKNGKRHGFGENWYNEDEFYEGEWFEGKRQGWGRMFYKDGSIYEGHWNRGKRNGRGMFRSGEFCVSVFTIGPANGDRYEGEWFDDKKEGQGKYFFVEKGRLIAGLWENDIAKSSIQCDLPPLQEKAPNYSPEDIDALIAERFPIPKLELANVDAVLPSGADCKGATFRL